MEQVDQSQNYDGIMQTVKYLQSQNEEMKTVLQSLQTEHTTGRTSPRTFRLPATPPVHVPARRLTS